MNLTREQCRQLDRRAMDEFGVPGVVLMENAGRGMADLLRQRVGRGPVAVCCGGGNNGGDGFVIARHLDNAGLPVRVLLFADPEGVRGDALANLRILRLGGVPVEALPDGHALAAILAQAEWLVDALCGTGLEGAARPPLDRVIAAMNASGKPILAVDIPSGLDADTGRPLGPCVQASLTATVEARKAGFDAPGASRWLGEVRTVSMGVPRKALDLGASA